MSRIRSLCLTIAVFTLVACGGGGSSSGSAPNPTPTTPSLTATNSTIDETAGTVTVTVTASATSSSAMSLEVTSSDGSASAGSDYQAISTTLQIPAGARSADITVTIIDDSVAESAETFSLTFSNPSNASLGTTSITITINDNDQNQNVGMDSRPSNTTCLAPTRTTSGGTLGLVNAFPNLPRLASPLKLAQAPGENFLYVSEREGTIKRFVHDPGTSTLDTYLNVSVDTRGEGGLLGFAFDPDWPTRKHLYVSYTFHDGSFKSRLSRFIVQNDTTLPITYDEEILIEVNQPDDHHNGGDVAFGPDRSLYWSLGDSGDDRVSQRTDNWLGSMLRIDVLGVAHPSPGYNIPASNPFAANSRCSTGDNAGDCPEIYAWGFRNPYRWSIDFPTGDLWVGDVGWRDREEINIVTAGGNYGWPCREGTLDNDTTGCDLSSLIDPAYEYPSGVVIGGFVYRGPSAGALTGRYVYANWAGEVRYLSGSQGTGFTAVDIVAHSTSIAGFGIDSQDELYALEFTSSARIYRLDSNGGTVQDNVADDLSATGCVDPANPQQPDTGLVPYAPVAPFWSDNAGKQRWIGLPNGSNIDVPGDGDFTFPPGTVLMKNFSLGSQLVETRLFMRHPDGDWAGYTYQWNTAQSSATRVRNGTTVTVGGQTWIIPSETDCMTCHTDVAGFSLGLETAQLNSDFPYPASGITDNQLEVFNHIDLFSVDVAEPVSALPALVDPFITSADIDSRARAYLHTNCAGCHQPGGPAPSGLDLRFDTLLNQTQACDVAPSQGDLGITDARIIAPGNASRSVLVSRVNRRDSFGMPPLASNIVDAQGVDLLSDWINQLSSCM